MLHRAALGYPPSDKQRNHKNRVEHCTDEKILSKTWQKGQISTAKQYKPRGMLHRWIE